MSPDELLDENERLRGEVELARAEVESERFRGDNACEILDGALANVAAEKRRADEATGECERLKRESCQCWYAQHHDHPRGSAKGCEFHDDAQRRADEATGEVERFSRLLDQAYERYDKMAGERFFTALDVYRTRARAARWKALARRVRRERVEARWLLGESRKANVWFRNQTVEEHNRANNAEEDRDAARWQAFGLAWAVIGYAADRPAPVCQFIWGVRDDDPVSGLIRVYQKMHDRARELEAALRGVLIEPSYVDEDPDCPGIDIGWVCNHCGGFGDSGPSIEHMQDCTYVAARAALDGKGEAP